MTIKINDRIILKNNLSGVIRYIGPIDGKENEWVGIELEDAKGSNDGSVEGKRYFQCQAKHGIFVKYSRLARGITEINDKNSSFSEGEIENKNYSTTVFDRLSDRNYSTNPNRSAPIYNLNRTEKIDNYDTHKESKNSPYYMDISNTEIKQKQHPSTHKDTSPGHSLLNSSHTDNKPNYKNFLTSSSLFEMDMYGDDRNKNYEKEIEKLKRENFEYKKLVQEFIDKHNKTLSTIYKNLEMINKKVSNLKIEQTTDKERIEVLSLVIKIYEAVKNGNTKTLHEDYESFKKIMAKYKISV